MQLQSTHRSMESSCPQFGDVGFYMVSVICDDMRHSCVRLHVLVPIISETGECAIHVSW